MQYGNGRSPQEITDKWVQLLRDAVELAQADAGGPDFSRFDSFLFLHAGYGHETGQLNDILSVFLSADDFEGSAAGGPIPADGVEIREAWILPEAVEGSDRAGAGLNGLMAKFFGHQLGLPGLSNFAAGLPGTGGWSLMDVGPNRIGFLLQGGELQTLFGFVPPHPISWSKARLGWIEPLVVRRDTSVAVAATDRTPAPGQHKAVRVPVSATEYFLIENRQRRGNAALPEGVEPPFQGIDVTWIEPDEVEFSGSGDPGSDPDAAPETGVWLGVEEYDAFVPGSGILIWHVDEAVIAAGEAEGGINNDRINPGIALEEADGERDIGNAFFDRQDVTEGSPSDPFFAGEGRGGILSKTLFGPGTAPSTEANTGVASGIRVEVLSNLADLMTVGIRFDGPLPGWPASLPAGARLQAVDLEGDGAAELLAENDGGVHLFAGGQAAPSGSFSGTYLAAAAGGPAESGLVFVASGRDLAAYLPDGDAPFWSASLAGEAVLGLHGGPGDLAQEAALAVATASRIELLNAGTGEVLAGSDLPGTIALGLLPDAGGGGSQLLVTTSDAVAVLGPDGPRMLWEHTGEGPLLPSIAGDLGGGRGSEIVSVSTDGTVSVLNGEGEVLWQAMLPEGAAAPAAIGDVDGDGSLEIAVATGAAVDLLRENGNRMPSFPVEFREHRKLGRTAGEPLLADLDGDGRQEILVAASAGGIAGIDDDGSQLGGFPVLTGAAVGSTPVAADLDGDGGLEVAVLAGDLAYAWDAGSLSPGLGGSGVAAWGQGAADAQGSRAYRGERLPTPPRVALLPADRAYCYPNPVGPRQRAHLRYYLSGPAAIELEVFDAIGRRVERRRWSAGSPQSEPGENEITWATGDYDSGLYLCRLEASGADGSRGHLIVRMAVAR